jgi:AcrR family transcriptional regulator
VLDAAQKAFAEHGLEAQMPAIARAAGVGVGTVYRHFPTKDALLQALLLDRVRRISAESRAALEEEPESWSAFVRLLRFVAHVQARDRSLAQFIGGQLPGFEEVRQAQRRMMDDLGELIEAAQRDGYVRADLEPGDVPLLFNGLGTSQYTEGERAVEHAERYLAIILDGLRAPGASPLPGRPLSEAEIDATLGLQPR